MEANANPITTFTKESWMKESLEEDVGSKNHEQDLETVDELFEQYLQDEFQDALVSEIFEDMVNYMREQAVPICEFFERDDVELVIENFL